MHFFSLAIFRCWIIQIPSCWFGTDLYPVYPVLFKVLIILKVTFQFPYLASQFLEGLWFNGQVCLDQDSGKLVRKLVKCRKCTTLHFVYITVVGFPG
jgi:hypothetical protein